MLDKSIREFTELSASKAPVPGGGGVSALVGSLAASLAEMVTNLTTGKKKYAEYEEEIQRIMKETDELRISLLSCVNEDAEAFEPLAKAYSMDKNDPDYAENMEKCLKTAAGAPLHILQLCCRVVELDERLAIIGSKLAVSDAATSVMLAHGAIYGAFINIKVNTRLMKNREYAVELEDKAAEMLQEYGERALKCYRSVEKRLSNG
ncbi:MAG: cyclodeaminase/cyclohydrolase family protein [Erysipelotrichaceae bacterium]|nr:cyclodeaminase/cyclohydrolase family protein [Erysipelotrichaceae bacterium]MBR2745684.1 cyclodeaminase/cyclohydrolase family protein [Erysipelotrichaceae bacterium]